MQEQTWFRTGPPSIGDGKKAGTEPDAGAKLSKGARRRLNQAKKKGEEEKQKAEEAARKATGRKTFQEPSDTEEDSPERPAHSAR